MTTDGSPLRLGVVVPCRNEARVVGRRIANLARIYWPPGRHAIVVVDDGSEDGTAGVAEEALAAARVPATVAPSVIANSHGPGKAGAILSALAHIDGRVDVVLLTDADVVFTEPTLANLVVAFEREPELGMACGTQLFVRELAEDGGARGPGAGALEPAGGRYDRWTAWVRRIESRAGQLFSVHGQCLAWRESLGIAPTPGIAADDLDLMFQVRARGAAVRLIPGAQFLEEKSAAGPARNAQALRRARAYFQVMHHAAESRLNASATTTMQWLAYRYLPGATPWLVAAAFAAGALLAARFFGAQGLFAILAVALLALLSPAGRDFVRLLCVIERARRSPLEVGDRWEMPRP